MRKSVAAVAAFGLLSAFTALAPATAEARDWNRGWRGEEWHEHHGNQGAAIALGVIGGILAGAAVASTQPYTPPPAYYYYPPSYYYGAPYAGYGYYR